MLFRSCDDLDAAPEQKDAGAGVIIVAEVVAARLEAGGKIVHTFDKGAP